LKLNGLLALEKNIFYKFSVNFNSFDIFSPWGRGLSFICTTLTKDDLCQLWLKLAQLFWKSTKCKSLTGDQKSSLELSALLS
jgi:hypothetical protein